MPHAALMVALTPHMSRLSKVIEEHIDDHQPSSSSINNNNNNNRKTSLSPSLAASDNNSPSRVSFSIEKKSPKFSSGRNTICTLNAEVVIRGEHEDSGENFEQLMWGRRFKVGKASKDGETIAEHRVCTVEIPEEIFLYAEKQEMGVTRARNDANTRFAGTAYKVAGLTTNDGRIQPKKSDLFNVDDNNNNNHGPSYDDHLAAVDELPDGCTFHLMLSLEIVKDSPNSTRQQNQQQQQQLPAPELLRLGTYEVELDPVAMMMGDSTLLPIEMFGPLIEERNDAVDIVAFSSIFAVIGDDVAAATHGDDSNPSLVSSVVALSMAAQYEHLVFNVFRPELMLYRQGMQMALSQQQQQQQQEPKNRKLMNAVNNDHGDQGQEQRLPGVFRNNNNNNQQRQQQQQQPRDDYYNDDEEQDDDDENTNNDDDGQYYRNSNNYQQQQQQSSPKPARPTNNQNNNNNGKNWNDEARAQHQRQKERQAPRLANTGSFQGNPVELAERRRQQENQRQQQQQQQQQQQNEVDDEEDFEEEYPRSPSARGVALSNNNSNPVVASANNNNHNSNNGRNNGNHNNNNRAKTATVFDHIRERSRKGNNNNSGGKPRNSRNQSDSDW